MKSEELGLPLFYREYPEYFDTPSNHYLTNEKNSAVEKLLKQYGAKTIFDMTCGTGAQVLYLAQHGYDVTGSDFSPALLTIAREKASTIQASAQFIDGDVRTLQAGTFDAVITIDNAIGHLVKSDFALALRNIHNNLNAGGIYLFDILNLEAMTDDVIQKDCQTMTDKRVMSDGTIIHNIRQASIDRHAGLLTSENHFTIEKENSREQVKNTCALQIYTMTELSHLLAENGFQTLDQHKIDTYSFQQNDDGYGIMTIARKQ